MIEIHQIPHAEINKVMNGIASELINIEQIDLWADFVKDIVQRFITNDFGYEYNTIHMYDKNNKLSVRRSMFIMSNYMRVNR